MRVLRGLESMFVGRGDSGRSYDVCVHYDEKMMEEKMMKEKTMKEKMLLRLSR